MEILAFIAILAVGFFWYYDAQKKKVKRLEEQKQASASETVKEEVAVMVQPETKPEIVVESKVAIETTAVAEEKPKRVRKPRATKATKTTKVATKRGKKPSVKKEIKSKKA